MRRKSTTCTCVRRPRVDSERTTAAMNVCIHIEQAHRDRPNARRTAFSEEKKLSHATLALAGWSPMTSLGWAIRYGRPDIARLFSDMLRCPSLARLSVIPTGISIVILHPPKLSRKTSRVTTVYWVSYLTCRLHFETIL